MPAATLSALRTQLGAVTLTPLYVLMGADEAERAAVAGEFPEVVEEDLRPFNVERLYGAETTVIELVLAASTFPMMAPRRIVVVLEAEKLLVPKRDSKAAEEEQERLEAFIESPPDHATVVFVCGSLDMRRRVVKKLLAAATVVDCGSVSTPAEAERWVVARAKRDGVALDAPAVGALVARCGTDLSRLRSGLERVSLYAMGQATVTAADVAQAVPAGPEAQADFGVAKAIWRNDTREALRELTRSLEAGAPPEMLMGQLRAAAERLPHPRTRRGIEAVFRTDLALKSSGGDRRILLERLVVELCGRN